MAGHSRSPTAERKRRRRRRPAAGGGAAAALPDFFSTLPDDVLLDIASRLPARNAVSLSVLARRFRHLPSLFGRCDSVSVSLPYFPIPQGANRPNRPMLLRRLALSPNRGTRISLFRPVLAAAIDRGVTELSIRLLRRMRLSKNVLSIRSLAVLSLDKCALPHSSVVACARLRTLKLTRVAIPQEILTSVLATASGLETLEMVFCTGFGGICTVESSSVRNFIFRAVQEQRETTLRTTGLMSVILYTRPRTRNVQLAPAPKVRKAYLHVAKPRDNLEFKIGPFLDAGSELACLTLRGLAMTLLSNEYKDTPELPTTYQNLRMLSVSLDFSCISETVFLVKLLERCPSLQQLTISAAKKKEAATLSFADHKERLAKVSCLSDLAEFNFFGFRAEQYQTELFVFVLSRTRKLKKLGVRFLEDAESTVKWILSVKRPPIEKRSTKYNHIYLELEYP